MRTVYWHHSDHLFGGGTLSQLPARDEVSSKPQYQVLFSQVKLKLREGSMPSLFIVPHPNQTRLRQVTEEEPAILSVCTDWTHESTHMQLRRNTLLSMRQPGWAWNEPLKTHRWALWMDSARLHCIQQSLSSDYHHRCGRVYLNFRWEYNSSFPLTKGS